LSEYYKVFIDNNETSTQDYGFVFSTDTDVNYFLKFSRAAHLFKSECINCSGIYEFSFFPDKKEIKEDGKIKQTIIEVIKAFIEKHSCPVIFLCDTTDSRGKGRLKLFQIWSNEYAHEYNLGFRVFEFDHYSLPIGLIAHNTDINFNQYIEEIDALGLG